MSAPVLSIGIQDFRALQARFLAQHAVRPTAQPVL